MAFRHLWEAENFVLNKTKGGELLVRVYCETGDTRTAKIESFFSGLFSCGAPINLKIYNTGRLRSGMLEFGICDLN